MSDKSMIDAAKATVIAYGNKDWNALRSAVAPGFSYDEVATHRTMNGIDKVVEGYKAWAAALPDSKATFDNALVTGNTVVLELTWHGHQDGPLQMPTGEIPASGNPIELRACQIIEMEHGKPKTVHHYFDMSTLMEQLAATP